jgi:hypothetical protein
MTNLLLRHRARPLLVALTTGTMVLTGCSESVTAPILAPSSAIVNGHINFLHDAAPAPSKKPSSGTLAKPPMPAKRSGP